MAKSGATATLTFGSGEKGSVGDIGNPSWSRDGRVVVYHSGPIETIPAFRAPGGPLYGGDTRYDLRFASGFPAVSPDGRQIAVSERTGRGKPDDRTSLVVWNTDGTNPRRIFHADGSLMSPSEQDLEEIWSYVAAAASSATADRLVIAIIDRLELLADQPRMGRVRSEFGKGVRSFAVRSYVIYYRHEAMSRSQGSFMEGTTRLRPGRNLANFQGRHTRLRS